jgi:hypothetical protein
MTVTLNLKPEVEAGLAAHTKATGMTLEDYLEYLVERDLSPDTAEGGATEESGMVWENGLFVYRTGRPVPAHIVDDAIRQTREGRAQHILGSNRGNDS